MLLRGHGGPPEASRFWAHGRGNLKVTAASGKTEDLVDLLAPIQTISREWVPGGRQFARAVPVSERPWRHAQQVRRLSDRQVIAELPHSYNLCKG